MDKLVSVIVPVYNDVVGAEIVLNALLAQTVSTDTYEIIIVDNMSTNGTSEVINRFERQHPDLIHALAEDRIQGSYAARNRGLESAIGEVVAFTDADCVPDPDWIECGLKVLEQEQATLAAGQVEMTFQDETPNFWEYMDAARKLNQRGYVSAGFGATANLFVRRCLVEKHGAFLGQLESGGDYEFGRRMTNAGEKLVYAEQAVVRHPARNSFKAIIKKSTRIARGQKQLKDMGLLEHGVLSWRQLIPTRSRPGIQGMPVGFGQKLGIIAMINLLRYINFIYRI